MLIKCDFFRARVMAQFKALADYIEYVEGQIQESHHSIRSQILIENRTPPDASEEAVQEWLCEREQEIDDCDRRYATDFRRILRFTIIMSVYTLAELNLSLIAKEIKNRKRLSSRKVQAKNPLKRFEQFWTKVAHLQWWPDPRWDALKDIEELRNCIAHQNGVVRENDGPIKQLLCRDCGVRLVGVNDPLADPDEAGTLEIEETFCRQAVQQMRSLFDEIFNQAGCFGPDHIVVE